MSDQPVPRSLPKHRTTQTHNKRIHTPNIHALSGIRTHDPSERTAATVNVYLFKTSYMFVIQMADSAYVADFSRLMIYVCLMNPVTALLV
jgi:hypothetical protein